MQQFAEICSLCGMDEYKHYHHPVHFQVVGEIAAFND